MKKIYGVETTFVRSPNHMIHHLLLDECYEWGADCHVDWREMPEVHLQEVYMGMGNPLH